MNVGYRSFSVGLLFLLIGSLVPGGVAMAVASAQDSNEKAAVAAVQSWAEAIRSGNSDRIVAAYTSDDRLRGVDASDMPIEFRNRTELRRYWETMLNRPDRLLNWEVKQLEVEVVGKTAIVTGQWQSERDNGERGKRILVGTLTLVLTQQNREWRIQHDHRSRLREIFVGMAVGGVSSPGPALSPGAPEYADAQWKGDGKSGVQGVATISPIRGGPEREGEPNFKPLANALITIRLMNEEKPLASQRTDAQGRFRIPLKPGRYRLMPFGPQPGGRLPHASPQDIVVPSGRFVQAAVNYDSGLR